MPIDENEFEKAVDLRMVQKKWIGKLRDIGDRLGLTSHGKECSTGGPTCV